MMSEHNREPFIDLPGPNTENTPISVGEAFVGENAHSRQLETGQSPMPGLNPLQPSINGSLPQAVAPGVNTGSVNDRTNSLSTLGPAGPAGPALSIMPLEARDGNRIEHEWIEQIEEAIEAYQNDPYAQYKEIIRIKADYIRKRYNRDIKLTEDN